MLRWNFFFFCLQYVQRFLFKLLICIFKIPLVICCVSSSETSPFNVQLPSLYIIYSSRYLWRYQLTSFSLPLSLTLPITLFFSLPLSLTLPITLFFLPPNIKDILKCLQERRINCRTDYSNFANMNDNLYIKLNRCPSYSIWCVSSTCKFSLSLFSNLTVLHSWSIPFFYRNLFPPFCHYRDFHLRFLSLLHTQIYGDDHKRRSISTLRECVP